MSSAAFVERAWLAGHAHVVGGKTVIDVGGKRHSLPLASFAQLLRDAG